MMLGVVSGSSFHADFIFGSHDARMETLGAPELLIVLLLALLFFGANKLPDIGKGLGSAIRSFKAGLRDDPEPLEPKPISGDKQ
jgi:sec-independent protein translocase protein TatA